MTCHCEDHLRHTRNSVVNFGSSKTECQVCTSVTKWPKTSIELILFVTKFDLVENFHWVNYSIHYTFYFIFVLLFVLDQTKTISYFYMFFLVNLNPCFAGPRVYLKISIFVILSYTRSFSNKTSPCWRCMEIQTNNMFAHIQPS